MIFDEMRQELRELVMTVRISERYCAAVSGGSVLPTPEAAQSEVLREHRISELAAKYGLN